MIKQELVIYEDGKEKIRMENFFVAGLDEDKEAPMIHVGENITGEISSLTVFKMLIILNKAIAKTLEESFGTIIK